MRAAKPRYERTNENMSTLSHEVALRRAAAANRKAAQAHADALKDLSKTIKEQIKRYEDRAAELDLQAEGAARQLPLALVESEPPDRSAGDVVIDLAAAHRAHDRVRAAERRAAAAEDEI